VSVPRVILPEISLGGIRLTDVEALVVEFPSALRLDGLLGMNILSRFRVTLECDTNTLVLRPV
jgi:predicted aspartyl protease